MNYQLPKVGLLLALALAWIGFALAPKTASAASLPATTCTATGPTSRTCDLWAKSTTINLTGTITATVWAYADSAGGVPTLPGPLLIVNQGDSVTVNLTNLLPETTALSFLGQNIRPDRIGVTQNGSKSYQFVASKPGTFIYEAGLLSNAQHQIAMGLAGVLIVRPNPATQAYANAASAFDDEAVVFLNEFDLSLNNRANPATFDMRAFTPRYRLINGKVHPNTLPIETQAGKRVLLRYVNAGLQFHAMSVLGLRQSLLAMDGSAYSRPRRTIAQTLSPGQTMDVVATVPTGLTAESSYPLYDANLILNNNGANSLGGMLTTIHVGTIVDNIGPTTSNLAAVPNPTNGSTNVAVTATADDSATGNSNIVAAEYFIDVPVSNGTGAAMSVSAAAPTATLSAQILAATIGTLAEGDHTLSAHAQDAAGNWGAATSITLLVDRTGPNTSNVTIAPNPNNGTLPISPTEQSVLVNATIDDTPLVLAAGVDATLKRVFLPMVAGGNSNAAQTTVQAAAIIPGTRYVAQAELFIDSVGANGSGFAMIASDGLFDSIIEAVYAYIPLTTINALSEGDHPIFVHGLDGAGNWGAPISGILRIDKTAPTVLNLTLTPNPTQGSATVTVTAVASDTASLVTQAEWFIDNDPGVGNGSAMTVTANGVDWDLSANINVTLLATGTYTVNVRAKDAAGNWSTVATATLTVSSASFAPGDVNGDGSVNIFDLQALINMIQHTPQPDSALFPLDWWQRADMVQDNAWNIFDLQSLINIILAIGP